MEHSESPAFEDHALSREEYIAAMTHFYRGEMHRSLSWRQRLDTTTNWAILTVAGMISFAFTDPDHPNVVILLSNIVILAYLYIEARRFRYFEVYRARLRMLEENFLIPIVSRQLDSPMPAWRDAVAEDLDCPKYKSTTIQAMGFRLRQNYVVIFGMVLGGWFLKLFIHPTIARSAGEMYDRVALGEVPEWLVLAMGAVFYVLLFLLAKAGKRIHGRGPDDEIAGLEDHPEKWKI